MSEDDSRTMPKVLIVDDSRMVRASIIKHIRGQFEVREEVDGEAAWQALVVDPDIQVVVTDIGMPRLDGYGLLERIRGSRVSRIQHLPVIVISGEEDDGARIRAHQLGANDFITKGVGGVELVARLDSLTRLGQTRRELEESRAALARQSPMDPASGLATEAYLAQHGAQQLALARRHRAEISAMAVDIDHYDALVTAHGDHVARLVTRKLSSILSTKVRKEDTVAQLGPSRFTVLSPSTSLAGCCAFALRLQKAIEKLVMTYREERIRISVTVGVASAAVDGAQTLSQLLGVAVDRAEAGRAAGGNRVIAEQGEVGPEVVERYIRQTVSIDHALLQLRAGAVDEVADHLPQVIAALTPLLELIESRLHCGIPLERLRRYHEAPADAVSTESGGSATQN